METLFAICAVFAFMLALFGSYAVWMLASFLVYKIRDNGKLTLHEYSQDW